MTSLAYRGTLTHKGSCKKSRWKMCLSSAQCYKTFFPSEISMSEFPQTFKLLSKTFNGTDYELNAIIQYILAS